VIVLDWVVTCVSSSCDAAVRSLFTSVEKDVDICLRIQLNNDSLFQE